MKKYFLSFLLIFCLFVFSGCNKGQQLQIADNYIMLSIDQSNTGQTKQSVVFSVNSNFLINNAKTPTEEFSFKQNLIKRVEELRNEFLFSFALVYMQNPIEEYKINQGVLISQVGYNVQGDYVGFEITFSSIGAWQYYHQSGETSQKEEKDKNIFIKKNKSEGIFPFSAKMAEGSNVGDKYKNCFLSASGGLSFEKTLAENYKPDFIYNYSSYYSRFHSNADARFKGDDHKYHHVWIEKDLNSCENICLYTYSIAKGWWIAFTLIICLSIMTISILILKRK